MATAFGQDRKSLCYGLNEIIRNCIKNVNFFGNNLCADFKRKYREVPFSYEIRRGNYINFNDYFNKLVSVYGEICTIRELIHTLGINKNNITIIPEKKYKTPDIMVDMNGQKIYFEVYTPVLQDSNNNITQDKLLNKAVKKKDFRQFAKIDSSSKKFIMVMTIGKINLAVWANSALLVQYRDQNPLDFYNVNNIYTKLVPNSNEYIIIYGCPFVDGLGEAKFFCSTGSNKHMKNLSMIDFKSLIS